MPDGCGRIGDSAHDALVQRVMEQEAFYREQLTEPFRAMVRWQKLYLAKRDDKRGEGEKWRANVFVPRPYSGVRAVVTQICEILNSADPRIQAVGVGDEDREGARDIERLLDYTLEQNRWSRLQDLLFTRMAIDGTNVPKLVWGNRARTVWVTPTTRQTEDFKKAVADAELVHGEAPSFAENPAEFMAWRNLVNTAGRAKIPEPPSEGNREVVMYRGPMVARTSVFDLRFDPTIFELQDQPLFMHRIVKPENWLLARTGEGDDKPFDPQQVAQCLGKGEERQSQWDTDIAEMLGISNLAADPLYQRGVELFECWMPFNLDTPYGILCNRKGFINKKSRMPFAHGMLPFIPLRNEALDPFFLGIGELQEPEALFYELNALRNLRLDAMVLRVLPMFMKMRDVALPERQRFIRPGLIQELSRADGFQAINMGNVPPEAFRECPEIEREIDECNATGGNVRGNQATIGRVSATESERRFSQALVRQKQRVLRLEDELSAIPPQALMLWHQFGGEEIVVKAAGGSSLLKIPRDKLLEAVGMDFRFRGASRALNRDLQVQQLQAFGKDFGSWLGPREMRVLMKRVLETMGHKNLSEIVSDEWTEELIRRAQAQAAPQPAAGGAQAGPVAAQPAAGGAIDPAAEPQFSDDEMAAAIAMQGAS